MSSAPHFPNQTPSYILSFQFSSWYPQFSAHSIKSTIIRPLSQEFRDYLDSDGVFVSEGSEDLPAESTLSDDEDAEAPTGDEDEEEGVRSFAFPDLDAKIRECVREYGAVFPKLNFSSPKDASWILPASSPLKCTSPSDVYLLLKSSDFITHDLNPESVFDGCGLSDPGQDAPKYGLELVLRKWYSIDKSRELRCFVRENMLIGISQRDTNYYDFLNESTAQANITTSVKQFWETNIKLTWESTGDYTFDILLTRDLSRAHILDFNPYAPRTDPLLFTYEELHFLHLRHHANETPEPQFKAVDSRTHPAANSSAPAHQHNMVPFEALSLSSGRDIQEFADLWREGIKDSMEDSDD